MTTSLVVGGGGGLGQYIAERLAGRGDDVIITSRTPTRAQQVAAELGPRARGLAVDLARPSTIADDLVDIDEVDNLVLTAFAPSPNTLHGFDITDAIAAITIKLVGRSRRSFALVDEGFGLMQCARAMVWRAGR